MFIKIILIYILFIEGSFSQLIYDDVYSDFENDSYNLPEWDYLMFSQRWPISSCYEWEIKNKNNVCNLPQNPDMWLVHGLWPTKTGTDGPNDCDSSIHFDPEQLEPLNNDLLNHWTNIEGNTKPNSFWAHEWKKHGTCASLLPQLDSVFNYFKKGLDLNKEFELTSILADFNIIPDSKNYTIEDISNAILKKLGKVPQIQCVANKQESFISEIRLCLNKSFDLIDCSSVGLELSNCSKQKPIKYLKDVPGEMAKASIDGYDMNIQEIKAETDILKEWYTIIKFLIWFTL